MSGAASYNAGRLKDATAAWKAALAEHDDNIELHRGLAAAYFDLGAMGPAQHHLERWLQLSPTDPRPHRLMGTIYKDFVRLPQAVDHYETVLRLIADDPRLTQLVPNVPQVRIELATCLADLGKFDKALEVLSTSQPTAEVLSVRAECHFAEGHLDQAQQDVRLALEEAPNYLPALLLSADVALDQEQVQEALDFAERAVTAYPKDSSARQRRGLVYQRLGRTEEAAAELRQMESLRELRLRFTDLHTRAGANPGDADVRYELGQVAHELALDDLALEWFNAALSIDPNHQDARRALAELLAPPSVEEQRQTDEPHQ
jgi:tetratricopeptide (TPR) repeat protein